MNAPIQIRNPDSVRMIRELAEISGQPITEVVTEAVRAALERCKSARATDAADRLAAMREAVRQFNALPVVGPLLTDDDLYDEEGFPQVMVVDASAVLAVVLGEDDEGVFEAAVYANPHSLMSAVNYWEVLVRAQVLHGEAGVAAANAWLSAALIQVVGADADQARSAAVAAARFRSRSVGRLNLGDCFAYALAAREGDGLLYKGDDFPRTDVKSALAP